MAGKPDWQWQPDAPEQPISPLSTNAIIRRFISSSTPGDLRKAANVSRAATYGVRWSFAIRSAKSCHDVCDVYGPQCRQSNAASRIEGRTLIGGPSSSAPCPSFATTDAERQWTASNRDLGDFGKAHIIAAAIIEAGRFGVRVSGHALRTLDAPAVAQIGGEAGCAESVTTYRSRNADIFCTTAHHAPRIRARERTRGEHLRLTERGAEQRALLLTLCESNLCASAGAPKQIALCGETQFTTLLRQGDFRN